MGRELREKKQRSPIGLTKDLTVRNPKSFESPNFLQLSHGDQGRWHSETGKQTFWRREELKKKEKRRRKEMMKIEDTHGTPFFLCIGSVVKSIFLFLFLFFFFFLVD